MKLLQITELLANAKKNHYAVGAFNVINLEMVQAIVKAAEIEKSPIILQVYHGDLEYIGGPYIAAIAKVAAESVSIPVALQLDHGQNLDQIISCINWGFSSIMIDLSSSDFQENVIHTKDVVKEAHAKGVTVEAELGMIFSGRTTVDEQKSSLTNPDLAANFVDVTNIDALAVSVGTAHGEYTFGPDINFDLLEKLVEIVPVPIVIHGGSFIPDKDIIKMIKIGVAKVNIGTEIMMGFIRGLKNVLVDEDQEITVRKVLSYAKAHVEKIVRKKIRLLNTLRTNNS